MAGSVPVKDLNQTSLSSSKPVNGPMRPPIGGQKGSEPNAARTQHSRNDPAKSSGKYQQPLEPRPLGSGRLTAYCVHVDGR